MKYVFTICGLVIFTLMGIISFFIYKTHTELTTKVHKQSIILNEVSEINNNISTAFINYSTKTPKGFYNLASEAVKADSKKSSDILKEHISFLESIISTGWKNLCLIFLLFMILSTFTSYSFFIVFFSKTKKKKRKHPHKKDLHSVLEKH